MPELIHFEINPRSRTASLRAMAGYNEPKSMLYSHLFKESCGLDDYDSGIILRTIEEVKID